MQTKTVIFREAGGGMNSPEPLETFEKRFRKRKTCHAIEFIAEEKVARSAEQGSSVAIVGNEMDWALPFVEVRGGSGQVSHSRLPSIVQPAYQREDEARKSGTHILVELESYPIVLVASSVSSNEVKHAVDNRSDLTNDIIPSKPKRPLSAYNYFFLHQRCLLLGEQFDEDLGSRMATRKKNRLHKRVHGKLEFRELAKHVSQEWKKLDPESRSFYQRMAEEDKKRYKREKLHCEACTIGGNKRKKFQISTETPSFFCASEMPFLKRVVSLENSICAPLPFKSVSLQSPIDCPSINSNERTTSLSAFQSREEAIWDIIDPWPLDELASDDDKSGFDDEEIMLMLKATLSDE